MIMESNRPEPRKSLPRRSRHVAGHTHKDGVVLAKIDQAKRRHGFYFRILAHSDLLLSYGSVPDEAVTLIPQDRLQETDLQGLAEIEDAETVRGRPAARVAEAARCLPVTEGVGMLVEINATYPVARRDVLDWKPAACEGRWRRDTHPV